MTVPIATYLYPLGGLSNVLHRGTDQTTYGNTTYVANSSYEGALAQAQAYAMLAIVTARRAHPPIENAGIRAGEIIGWRAWRILGGRYLKSMSLKTIWPADEPMTGNVEIGEGIYAFNTCANAMSEFGSSFYGGGPRVIGGVLLWGQVIEYEHGYRAQFAKVASLDYIYGDRMKLFRRDRTLENLREIYGVAVRPGIRAMDENEGERDD